MEIKECGVCEVLKEALSPWSVTEYSVGKITFEKSYDEPPRVLLTPIRSHEDGWLYLLCSVQEVTKECAIIDFDGLRMVNGQLTFQQEVYPGAKCYWVVV